VGADLRKPLALGLVVASCVPSILLGQNRAEDKQPQVWSIQGLKTAYCVRFVIDPRAAAKELKDGFRLIPANQDRTLDPSIQQLIKGQPEFGSWSPSDLCFYFSDAVQIGTRRVAEKNPRNQQMLAVWTLASQEEKSGARRDLVLGFFSARGSLTRAAEQAGVRLSEAHASVLDSADTSNDVYNVKLERSSLTWRGRPSGDSTRVEGPIEQSWLVAGSRGTVWSAQFIFHPTSTRALVGSLSVEGKGDLGKALKGSPIRFVGPLYRGGSAELRFSR
jgi:hypothetical protein